MVEGKGQFSIRGGIIDFFSPIYDNPVRIELFDNETDSIRFFDVLTQRSISKEKMVVISACPRTDIQCSGNLKKRQCELQKNLQNGRNANPHQK